MFRPSRVSPGFSTYLPDHSRGPPPSQSGARVPDKSASGPREFPAGKRVPDSLRAETRQGHGESRDRAGPAEVQSLRIGSRDAPALAAKPERLHRSVNDLGVLIHRSKS